MKRIINWLRGKKRDKPLYSKEKLFAQGSLYLQQGGLEEARKTYQQAHLLFPEDADAMAGLGYVLMQQGLMENAVDILKKGHVLHPKHTDILFLLGRLFMQRRQWLDARNAWTRLLDISPRFEDAYMGLVQACVYSGDWVAAEKFSHQAAFLFSRNASILLTYATVLVNREKRNDALPIYRKAYALNPGDVEIVGGLAECCRAIGRIDEAIELHGRALELAPHNSQLFSNYLYALMYSVSSNREQVFEAHLEFARRFEAPLIGQHMPFLNRSVDGRRLRVGYVSGDFRNHSLASFIEPVFREHDRQQVEVFAYFTCHIEDEITRRLRILVDQWRYCAHLSDEDMASCIRTDGIDVLIDLSGHTGFNRLLVFARKPAPVQMTWLGYQSTTGLSSMDYRITDKSLDPPGMTERFHSEKLLRLPLSGVFFPILELPPLSERNSEFFTFGCLNNPSKITESALAAWADILQRAPLSQLLIGNSDAAVEQRIRHFLQNAGVESHRLQFVPRLGLTEYLALHGQIDLMLDTFPYNGGTTTFYAAWMGVPVMALAGTAAVDNVGYSVMGGIGLPQMCSDTLAGYVDKAVAFALEPAALPQHAQVRAGMQSFADRHTATLCRALEHAFRQAIQTWEATRLQTSK